MDTPEDYIEQKRKLQTTLLDFIDDLDNSTENYKKLMEIIENQQIRQNKKELLQFLLLLSNITNYHHRNSNFIQSIEQIITSLSKEIKDNFEDELYERYQDNKLFLYLLSKTKLLTFNQNISRQIDKKDANFRDYFSLEIGPFLNRSIYTPKDIDELRSTGENRSNISKLIRTDSVEEFIQLINKNSISVNDKIAHSNFETNPLLYSKEPKLIQYAAFFGSIQIFKYLQLSGAELDPDLWIYVVHSKSGELIHLLEEIGIDPPNKSYESCLEEAIKCHHNDIANYILANLLNKKVVNYDLRKNITQNPVNYGFLYHNYEYIPPDFGENNHIYYAIKYGYYTVVDLLLKNDYFDLNTRIDIFYITSHLF